MKMFFKSELEDTKKPVEEKGQQECERPETGHVSRLCRICQMQLKRGPNSPRMHTGFPRVAGKYVHCSDKVFSIYQPQGMQKDELERLRWLVDFYFIFLY